MKNRIRTFLQVLSVVLFALILWRFFPIAAGFLEGAAFSIRRFWWVILLIGLVVWLIWVLSQQHPMPPNLKNRKHK